MSVKYKHKVIGCLLTMRDRSGLPAWNDAIDNLVRARNELSLVENVKLLKAILAELLEKNELGIVDELITIRARELFDSGITPELQDQINVHRERIRIQEQAESIAREKAKREKERLEKRQTALNELRACLLNQFLFVHDQYSDQWQKIIDPIEFKKEVVEFVINWFNETKSKTPTLKIIPDEDQAWAIATGLQNTLVVARAGSGKTATVVNRAFFLNRHCGVNSSEILLLAFNKEAIKEIQSRLKRLTGEDWPYVMNFHQLAYAIVHPDKNIIFDDDANKTQSKIIQEAINKRIRDKNFQPQIRELMLTKWRDDWENITRAGDDKTKSEFLDYRRSLSRETLGRDYVKSHGEKVIANCLFEHGLNYKYEHARVWDRGSNRKYRPDFTIFRPNNYKEGIVIEYFGMRGDPEYDKQIKEKRGHFINQNSSWKLIEVFPEDIVRGDFQDWLIEKIQRCGFPCTKLTEEEIWKKSEDRAIDSFTKTIASFIVRARNESLTAAQLKIEINQYQSTCPIEQQFLSLASEFYSDYLSRLSEDFEDFQGLMIKSGEIVASGKTNFQRKVSGDLAKLKFIFIDEFQDFSLLFHNLIEAIRSNNSSVSLFCVGDDWQAINGFAGSDLTFYRNFTNHYPNAIRVTIPTNYRSCPEIVRLGNQLMAGSTDDLPTASRNERGNIYCIDLAQLVRTPAEHEKNMNDADAAIYRLLNAALDPSSELVTEVPDKHAVAILSRRKKLVSNTSLEEFRKLLNKEQNRLTQINTSHGFKGKQACTVLVSDAVVRRYPLVHPNWIFQKIFGDTLEKLIEDEKRLFYVAITRATDCLVLLTDSSCSEPCIFVKQLGLPDNLKWKDIPCQIEDWSDLEIRIGNNDCYRNNNYYGKSPPNVLIKDRLKALDFTWVPKNNWAFWKKPVSRIGFVLEDFLASTEIDWPDGIEIRVCDGNNHLIHRVDYYFGQLRSLSLTIPSANERNRSRINKQSEPDIPF